MIIAAGYLAGEFKQNCITCGKDKKLREQWGCDTDAKQPVISMDCIACHGSNPDCAECHGVGTIDIFRCPVWYVDQLEDFLQMYCMYKKGFLPVSGGALNQTHQFIEAVQFLDSQLNKLEKVQLERERKKNAS